MSRGWLPSEAFRQEREARLLRAIKLGGQIDDWVNVTLVQIIAVHDGRWDVARRAGNVLQELSYESDGP